MYTKLISILLCVTVFFGLPTTTATETAPMATPPAEFTVIAASDFQPKSSFGEGVKNVRNIISKIKADGITSADGFLFCGDYDAHSYGKPDKTKAGIDMFKDEFDGMIDPDNMLTFFFLNTIISLLVAMVDFTLIIPPPPGKSI